MSFWFCWRCSADLQRCEVCGHHQLDKETYFVRLREQRDIRLLQVEGSPVLAGVVEDMYQSAKQKLVVWQPLPPLSRWGRRGLKTMSTWLSTFIYP